jgi:hypothetical protein
MSEPTKQPTEPTEPEDKPRYETPRVVTLGNTPEGEGGIAPACTDGSTPTGACSGGASLT